MMMKKLLSIATLMLVALMLNAQAPSWTAQSTNFVAASRGIQWISIPSSQVVWCTAYDGSGGGADIREFCKTTNGGTNWTATVIPTTQIAATMALSTISAIDANIAYIAAYPTAGTVQGVFKTTNGGANWVNTSTGTFTNTSSFINNCGFWDADNGIAQGDAWGPGGTTQLFELYTTTNAGVNWAVVTDANQPYAINAEDGWTTSFFNATFAGNKCAWFGTNKGRIFHTTNGGINWSVASSTFADCAGSIAFTEQNNGVAICINGTSGAYLGFSRTTDGGAHWAAETTTGTIYKASVCAVPGHLGWYVRTGSDPNLTTEQGSQISFDYGVSWTEIDNSVQHTEVSFLDRDNGFSGGFSGAGTGIYKFVPGSVGIDFNSIEKNELNVYPNPCTGNFSLINAENSVVNIYNTTGSLVYSAKIGNNKSFSIDLSKQAKGMYIVTVQNSKGTKTQKLSIN